MIQERVIFLREIREFSCVGQKEMFERVWSTIYEDLPGTSSLPGLLFGENPKFSVYDIRKFQNFVCRCSIFYWSMNTLLYRTCIFQYFSVYLIKSIWFERVILKSWMKFMILVLARNVCKNRATGFAYRFYFSDMQSYNIYNRRCRSRNWSTQINNI